MVKKNNILILFFITALLIISGCSNGDERTSGFSGDAFNGGDKALDIQFAEGTPPETVRDGGLQPFSIRFLIENVGEYDIETGEAFITLSGFSLDDLGISNPTKEIESMRGVRKQGSNVIQGGRDQLTYSNLRYLPEIPSGTNNQRIYANLCYPYETQAVTSLCISGDTLVNYDDENTICDLEGEKEFANSGAPVKIENVKQFPGGQNSVDFQFDIAHTPTDNNGRVFSEDSLDSSCEINGESTSSVSSSIEEGYVEYEIDASPLEVNCDNGSNIGEVKLNDDKTTVYCSIDTTGENEYVKLVNIDLTYDYLERISEQITIEHVSR